MMIDGSLQAELMGAKSNGQQVRNTYFGNNIIYICKPVMDDNPILWKSKNMVRFDMPRVLFT